MEFKGRVYRSIVWKKFFIESTHSEEDWSPSASTSYPADA